MQAYMGEIDSFGNETPSQITAATCDVAEPKPRKNLGEGQTVVDDRLKLLARGRPHAACASIQIHGSARLRKIRR